MMLDNDAIGVVNSLHCFPNSCHQSFRYSGWLHRKLLMLHLESRLESWDSKVPEMDPKVAPGRLQVCPGRAH